MSRARGHVDDDELREGKRIDAQALADVGDAG